MVVVSLLSPIPHRLQDRGPLAWRSHKTRLHSFSQTKRNASLPYPPPPPALFTSLTALPFGDSFSLRSSCLQADFPNFTQKSLARVGTRGWGLAPGAGDEQNRKRGWFSLLSASAGSWDDPEYKWLCALCWINCNLGVVLTLVSLETRDNGSHYSGFLYLTTWMCVAL